MYRNYEDIKTKLKAPSLFKNFNNVKDLMVKDIFFLFLRNCKYYWPSKSKGEFLSVKNYSDRRLNIQHLHDIKTPYIKQYP